MRTKEEIKTYLKGHLEGLIANFSSESPNANQEREGYYQERLDHIDEILPLAMAQSLRSHLTMISQLKGEDLETYLKNQEIDPMMFFSKDDLIRSGVIMKYQNDSLGYNATINIEARITEIMNMYGYEIPTKQELDNLRAEKESMPYSPETSEKREELDARIQLAEAQRGETPGNYGVPHVIPSKLQGERVNESNFAKIHESAKGRVNEALGAIKSVRDKNTQEKDNVGPALE